jgi:hypothetical protein
VLGRPVQPVFDSVPIHWIPLLVYPVRLYPAAQVFCLVDPP